MNAAEKNLPLAVAALLASDTAEEIEALLVYMLGYDPEVTDNGTACETTVWDCDGNLIGTGKGRAHAMADAVIYLETRPEPEPADDGSALEHGYFLNHGDR